MTRARRRLVIGREAAVSSARNMRATWISFLVCLRRLNMAPFIHRQNGVSS